ncbi:sperm associated antigen 9 [Chelydra serpentina]|uniref:Sperm associated antigen 9 n=1 Tax=Chelydra serpentina TaxID=8475 RepID=A0A8T1RYA7_CHESE|nr:sperm associated antigen 9 [Chelydra serpentina]
MEEIFGGEEESASPALCEELVSGLAAGLYGELERLVGAYGRGAVAGLLPQLVSVLEALERAGEQIRERDEALELLRDDRLGLLGQYERERAGRKRAEEVRCRVPPDPDPQPPRPCPAQSPSIPTRSPPSRPLPSAPQSRSAAPCVVPPDPDPQPPRVLPLIPTHSPPPRAPHGAPQSQPTAPQHGAP